MSQSPSQAASYALGFIGGGQMATALAQGSIASHLVAEKQIVFAEPNPEARQRLKDAFPESHLVDTAEELLERTERVVLSVKPQVLLEMGSSIASKVTPKHLLVSIAAGISLKRLTKLLATDRIVRVMPNTPCQIRKGASGIAAAAGAQIEDRAWVEKLMGSVGLVVHVSDAMLHAVTGLSGSGPAYGYLMIEAMSDGGVAMGLPRPLAIQLAAQTLLGAAAMVLETGKHPGVLKDQVTSPAGTTIEALRVLEESGLRSALIEAVVAAAERSMELGQEG